MLGAASPTWSWLTRTPAEALMEPVMHLPLVRARPPLGICDTPSGQSGPGKPCGPGPVVLSTMEV